MAETWYRVSVWGEEIVPVEILRYTEHCVFLKETFFGRAERRVFRHGGNHDYYPTKGEAKSELISRLTGKVEQLRSELNTKEAALRRLSK